MKKRIKILPIQAGLTALDSILSHVSPIEALKIIFTPENVERMAYGATKAAIEANKK